MNDSTTRFAAITVVCVHAFMPPNLTGRNYTRHFRRAVWTVARHGKKAATSFAWEAGRTTPHVSYARHCAAGEQCVPTTRRQPRSGTLMSVNRPALTVAQSATSPKALGARTAKVRANRGRAFRRMGVQALRGKAMAVRPQPV